MKKILPFAFTIIWLQGFSQAPQTINYQAVVRNAQSQPVANNTPVRLRMTIRDSSTTGTVVFTEIQNAATNQFGLVNVQIGSVQNLAVVNWGNGTKYLQIEADINNLGSYVDMGTSQLLSVPYALYAGNSAVGPTGPTGLTGATGITGATGPSANVGTGNGSTAATLIYTTRGF